MNVLVVDAQGGGVGKQLVAAIKKQYPVTLRGTAFAFMRNKKDLIMRYY